MSLFKNAASLMLTSAVSVPLGIGTSVVLARYLSLDDRGYMALATAVASLSVFLTQVGWPGAVVYRVRRSGTEAARAAATTLLAISVLAALAVLGALALRGPLVDALFAGAPLPTYSLAVALMPFLMLGTFFSGVARAIDRFDFQNAYRLTVNAGRFVALSLVLVLGGGALLAALGASIAVYALAAIGLVIAIVRQTGLRRSSLGREFLATARVGSRSWVLALAVNAHERVDAFMLGYLLGDPSEVALYTIAAGVIVYLQMVPEAVASAALPEFAERGSRDGGEVAALSLRHALIWVGIAMLVSGVAAPIVLPFVYGPAYAASVLPFLVLLPAVSFQTVYLVLSRYFYANDRSRISIAIQTSTLVLNVSLNLLWIPEYGILGAAGASLASYGAAGILATTAFVRMSGVRLRDALVPRRSDAAGYARRAAEAWRSVRGSGSP